MSPELWRQIEELYSEVLKVAPERRARLLEQAGPEVRSMVESLLAQPSGDFSFAPFPADQSASRPVKDPHEATTWRGDTSRPAAPAPADSWGHFRLLEKVGQGAFGEVYRAFDTVLEREVAVKLLFPGMAVHGNDRQSVLREARLLARVRHPNVVPVYGVDTFNGRVGFWSDFVHGKTLSSLLSAQGRFSAREAALIGADVLKALSAVHSAGLLHRDIKAGNVMREDGGRIVLMDFGLSGEHSPDAILAGTPSYMAPELFAGKPATVASDIYSVGVLLFQLLTGSYPVTGRDIAQLEAAHESGARRSLYDERSDLPEALVRVVETAIAPDPAKRFGSSGQMIAALSESIGLGPVSGVVQPAPATPSSRWSRLWMWPAAIAVLAAIVWFSPLRGTLLGHSGGPFVSTSAHADYLKAQGLLDHYYRLHQTEAAVGLFNKTIEEDPKFALAYAGLCRAYFIQFRNIEDPSLIDRTQAACAKALDLDRDLPSPHVTLGMLYTWTTRNDLAAQELQTAISLDSRNAEAWAALAELYNRQGRTKDVVPTFQKALDLAPLDWRWPNQLANYYLINGKFDEAAHGFQQALQLANDNALLWNNLAIAYKRENKFAEAQMAYRRAIDIEPRDFFFSNLGELVEQEGSYAEAAALYEKAIRMNPSNYRAFGSLGLVYAHTPGQSAKSREAFTSAISLCEELRKNNPRDATLLSQLGSYYAWTGNKDRSLPLLREAAALSPDDPMILYRAGEGYELNHQRDEALHWIGLALAHKYSMDALKRVPEMRALTSDPRFVRIATFSR